MPAMGNFPQNMATCYSARFVEALPAADTYRFDVFVPAGAIIIDAGIHNEVLWTAGTSATFMLGDFTTAATPVAIDADGFIAATSLKATDMLTSQSISINGISVQGGLGGAYATVGTNTHVNERVSLVDRWLRFEVVCVGTSGTAGRSYVWAVIGQPVTKDVTGLLAAAAL